MNMGVSIGTNLTGDEAKWVDRVVLKQMGISHKFASYKESQVNYVPVILGSFKARVTHQECHW